MEQTRGDNCIPDFDNVKYRFVTRPSNSTLLAWSKLEECERRLIFFEWVEQLMTPHAMRYRVLLNDSVSAFFLTFEATIQWLLSQFNKNGIPKVEFFKWLDSQDDYNITVKGLRTMRHFEAHHQTNPPKRNIMVSIESGFGKKVTPISISADWRYLNLNLDFDLLVDRYPLKGNEAEWEKTVQDHTLNELFQDGITRLNNILHAAESKFSSAA